MEQNKVTIQLSATGGGSEEDNFKSTNEPPKGKPPL